MSQKYQPQRTHLHRLAHAVPVSIALLASGCAQSGLETGGLQMSATGPSTTANALDPSAQQAPAAADQQQDVALKPEAASVVRESRALRAAGKKEEALSLLDKAPDSDTDPGLIKERGFVALELGKIDRAKDLLTKSKDADATDWRVLSALGAALSADGKQKEAQAEFTKALALAPEHPSILNNLALSYALDGKHAEAERLLRRASVTTQSEPQTRQNLALILGLKGNIAEARKVSAAVLPPDAANANVSYMEGLKAKNTTVSRAEPEPSEDIHSVTFASAKEQPIMHLGAKKD
jgi:Flp pilus assembly protein TadD